MKRVNNVYRIVQLTIEDEPLPQLNDTLYAEEWDETGSSIKYEFVVDEILGIEPVQINNKYVLNLKILSKHFNTR